MFATRGKSFRSRDRVTLEPADAPTLVRVDHSMRKVQLYTLVAKTTITRSLFHSTLLTSTKLTSVIPITTY